jgi:O-antigen ligase
LIKSRWQGAIFPIALLAFASVGIRYIGLVFTPATRWIFLALLGLALIKTGRLLGALNTKFGIPALLYCGWCLFTVVWSIVPELSLMKGVASIATILIFSAGGRRWASGWRSIPALFYLAPIAAATLLSMFGTETQNGYSGITGNPNYLGLIVAASTPFAVFLLYRVYTRRSKSFIRLLVVLGAASLGILLWRSGSRAAILCAACVIAFSVVALRPTKIVLIFTLFISAAAIVSLAVPEFEDRLYTRFVVKYSTSDDVFYTRREVWGESLEGARQGGWLGLGFGASYGDDSFSGGLTSVGYGREKGNSQLAILEELGIVGAVLYAILILSIISELLGNFRRAPDRDTRMELALTTGLAIGLLAQSVFEAWWTSPGSVESTIFWATVGVGSGILRRENYVSREYAMKRKAIIALQASASSSKIESL